MRFVDVVRVDQAQHRPENFRVGKLAAGGTSSSTVGFTKLPDS